MSNVCHLNKIPGPVEMEFETVFDEGDGHVEKELGINWAMPAQKDCPDQL